MIFTETQISGAFVVEIDAQADHRGMFARTFCEREFAARGIEVRMVQSNVSLTRRRGTVRGMHFQWPPSREGKLVRCTRGRLLDVVIDLRPDSPTYTQHIAVEIDAAIRRAIYIPPGLAHGFQTLEDDTEIFYQMSDFYDARLSAGVRWNDPSFEIEWPLADVTILDRDRTYPDFDARKFAAELVARARGRQ
jgi:dTDP-4-dehydrorhamnose 3,5-epimerase